MKQQDGKTMTNGNMISVYNAPTICQLFNQT